MTPSQPSRKAQESVKRHMLAGAVAGNTGSTIVVRLAQIFRPAFSRSLHALFPLAF